jgi:uncharacterized protein (UPF0332 family)
LEQELLSLLKYKKAHIVFLKHGVRLEAIGGAQIDVLMLRVSADRFALARYFLASARRLQRMRPPSFRDSVSRSYYSMYHAARTIAYVFHQGDDHEDHMALYKALPDDFPDVDRWRNDLKDARLRRNEADYDPYPKPDGEFAGVGRSQLATATSFLAEAENYLRTKGCPI